MLTLPVAALVVALVLPVSAVAYYFYRLALTAEYKVMDCWDTIGNLACALRVQSLTSAGDSKPDCIGFHTGVDDDDEHQLPDDNHRDRRG